MTQYGVGPGVLFSYFLDASPHRTYETAAAVTLAGSLFFYCTFYKLASLLLRSRSWALLLTLFAAVMNFYGPMPFRAPSGWPLRFPLAPLFFIAFVYYWTSARKTQVAYLCAAGFLAAASTYWVTEIGIYLICIGIFCCWATEKHFPRVSADPLIFAVFAASTFIALSVLGSGKGALSFGYYLKLFEPLLLYAGGFGAWPVNWLAPYEYPLTVIIPLILCATVLWALSCDFKQGGNKTDAPHNILLMISLFSLAQLTKFWNMSLAAVWFSNAYFPALVFVFWIKTAIDQVSRSNPSIIFAHRSALCCGMAAIGIFYVVAFKDPWMDTKYGVRGYWLYPSMVRAALDGKQQHRDTPTVFSAVEVSAADVALIEELVAPEDQAFIYSSRDWAFLLKTKRAPGFQFIPSTMTPLRAQIDGPLSRAKLLLIDNKPPLWRMDQQMSDIILEKIASEYSLIKVGDDLSAYRRIK
ncbi:MAG TPA: hypothetical protein VNQ56_16205 [Pseudolabrys sp.]|nr:hypothetical protein [Pseudolabrys sp.]